MAVYKRIQGKSIYLLPASIDDAEFTFNIRQDPERTKFLHRVSGGLDCQQEWIANQIKRPGDYFFVVYSREGQAIGTDSVYNIDYKKKEAEHGRTILNGNPIQNMEAIIATYDFAFYDLDMELLWASCTVDNTPSIGEVKRLGGIEVSREWDKELDKELIIFNVLKKDYDARHNDFLRLIDRFGDR